MKEIAVYPGSFDPITNGHVDVITRAKAIFDKVVVAIAQNISKKGLFEPQERLALVKEVIGDDPQVEVDGFSGLLVDYVRGRGGVIVRGLRAVADFEYEFQLALMNRRLAPAVDTVFLITDERSFYISSSLVREVAGFGGDVSDFVPPAVKRALERKLG
jgi:pantetheine-phosphate adenylyltransferase